MRWCMHGGFGGGNGEGGGGDRYIYAVHILLIEKKNHVHF